MHTFTPQFSDNSIAQMSVLEVVSQDAMQADEDAPESPVTMTFLSLEIAVAVIMFECFCKNI